MTFTKTLKAKESSFRDTPRRFRKAPIEPSFVMPDLNNFGTMKVRKSFLAWLKRESARRGLFIYEMVEDIASVALAGATPWGSNKR